MPPLSTNRTVGRVLASIVAVGALGFSLYTGFAESMPEFRVYDGVWMVLWTVIAVLLVAPLVWRWRRERSLAVITLAAIVGCWAPLVYLAYRLHMPIMVRVKGAWLLSGADTVGLMMPVSAALGWLALRPHVPAPRADQL
ncbi:MAG: hypothetical protein ABJD11_06430 [Gemmatimonadota bacterium]